ncbi:MAG: M23 family metallopeptidase [Verrucomicrobiales bacterium]|nr:M23 family metallopeptidase [Verrucomicrobiales bacterium]
MWSLHLISGALKVSKYFENVDLKQHFREFYRFFLPLFVLIFGLALAIWVSVKPKSDDDPAAGEEKGVDAFVGLLNPNLEELIFDPAFAVLSPVEMVTAPTAVRFDPPMGSEHAGLTYNAQPFLTTRHLGDDINGIGGNNSDLNDPVFAVADGRVIYTGWPADGWGNVAILLHELPDGRLVESFYGHLDRIGVFVGQRVRRGDRIGEVGNADGKYLAHLHFELRTSPALDCGAGYADAALDRLPGEFSLIKWRGRPDDQLAPPPVGDSVEPQSSIEVETNP